MKQTAVEWLVEQLKEYDFADIKDNEYYIIKIPTWILKEKEIQAKAMEKEQMLHFGDFIIDELEPMAQNREWVEERYNYFKSE